MIYKKFKLITRCLHITNSSTYEIYRNNLFYNKIKIKRLVKDSKDKFRNSYNLIKIIFINEMMLRYKDNFLPIRQYMLAKLVK